MAGKGNWQIYRKHLQGVACDAFKYQLLFFTMAGAFPQAVVVDDSDLGGFYCPLAEPLTFLFGKMFMTNPQIFKKLGMKPWCFLIVYIAIGPTACSVTDQFIAPPYTNVEKILNVRIGMTLTEINQILGIPPYNVLYAAEEGITILLYNYRLKDRQVLFETNLTSSKGIDPSRIKSTAATDIQQSQSNWQKKVHGEDFQNKGDPWYSMEKQRLFVILKDGKVRALISNEGQPIADDLIAIKTNIGAVLRGEINKIISGKSSLGEIHRDTLQVEKSQRSESKQPATIIKNVLK